ncbi:hypothetical protein RvY_01954-1 [Ramazzottius varieornatus]|uniref:Uncharacterized protein n=1 Tax=Ramazzottius varieornatus TaxID=947166 RepID=A0A1D1UI60_RAMVA|nr:hypothetical protein RvY_01954-1 [Ramazzottius varieornatus]
MTCLCWVVSFTPRIVDAVRSLADGIRKEDSCVSRSTSITRMRRSKFCACTETTQLSISELILVCKFCHNCSICFPSNSGLQNLRALQNDLQTTPIDATSSVPHRTETTTVVHRLEERLLCQVMSREKASGGQESRRTQERSA